MQHQYQHQVPSVVPGAHHAALPVVASVDYVTPGTAPGAYFTPHAAFGDAAITYVVLPTGPATSRILARVRTAGLDPIRRWALGWGDLIMMRKQLRTFAALAARTAAAD